MPAPGGRKLANWLDSFIRLTAPKGAPQIWCLWSGLATIASALERKVWLRNDRGQLHPNLYVVLVGPPGTGKTLAIDAAFDMLQTISGPGPQDHHIASSNVSHASLVDDIRDAERRVVHPDKVPSVLSFNSLAVIAEEFSVFMPQYENNFLSILNKMYTGEAYSERKRTRELMFSIPHPQLNLLAGTQPAYLSDILPEAAWNQGFISRTVLVYNGEQILKPLWGGEEENNGLKKELEADLKVIGDLYGEMSFDPAAVRAINAWHLAMGPPRPEHPKLIYYSFRRTAQVLKLCMIASAARGNDLRVTIEDYQMALGWLLEAEHFMPDIFKAMTTGGDMKAVEETWYFCYEIFMKERHAVAENRVVTFLMERVPSHAVVRILDLMLRGGILEKKLEPKIGPVYLPRSKKGKSQ